MEERNANAVVLEWVQGHPDRDSAEQVYRVLAMAVASLLSDGATAGVAEVDGERLVIAADTGAFFKISIDLSADAVAALQAGRSPLVKCRVLRLNEFSGVVEVDEHLTQREVGPVGSRVMRHRRWRFELDEPVEFSTEAVIRAPFRGDAGPNSAERVACVAARQMGWAIPEVALDPQGGRRFQRPMEWRNRHVSTVCDAATAVTFRANIHWRVGGRLFEARPELVLPPGEADQIPKHSVRLLDDEVIAVKYGSSRQQNVGGGLAGCTQCRSVHDERSLGV